MKEIIEEILVTKRKALFRSKPMFDSHGVLTSEEIDGLEKIHGCKFPEQIRYWWMHAGKGHLNDTLAIDPVWLQALSSETTRGHFAFAQDELGNFYTFTREGPEVYFVARKEPEYGQVGADFEGFMIALRDKNFDVFELVASATLNRHDWYE